MNKIFPVAILTLVMLIQPAFAQDADYNARVDAAKAYLQAAPVQKSVDAVFEAMGKNPQSHMTAFDLNDIKSFVNVNEIQKSATDALVKTFTVDELKAMTQFYGSAVGQSVMKKMPDYTKEFMPSIQHQVRAALIAHLQKMQQQGSATPAGAPDSVQASTPVKP